MRDNTRKHNGYAYSKAQTTNVQYVYDELCEQEKRGYDGANLLLALAELIEKDKMNGVSYKYVNAGYPCKTCRYYHTTSSPKRGELHVFLVDGSPVVKVW